MGPKFRLENAVLTASSTGLQWLMPVILAAQEAEIRRIAV
jgi:hypothetical protein